MNDRIDREANLALFCDYENVAIGAREARFETFDISLVLERLLDKGKIVVKKAYADWGRYKTMRRPLHEASFELIEIPHVSYSGKNSADIRLVVDALDLCYTKGHVDVFVIISGDSDFSPLAAKLRENAKRVIGVGVKNSSADMLMESCDEFIYYDDLVRDKRAAERKPRARVPELPSRAERGESAQSNAGSHSASSAGSSAGSNANPPASPAAPAAATPAVDEVRSDEKKNKEEALELVLETVDALFRDRDDSLWGSMVKQTIKRKRPQFNETFHGYRNFNQLLEDARARGLLEIEKDSKSGGYLITAFGPKA